MGRRRSTGRKVGRLLVGAAPRVWDSRAGGEDSIQGRVEAIWRRQRCRAGSHGWRRPWGAGAARLLPRAPTGCVTGKTAERKEIRSDRLGPHGSERKRKVGNSWAGCLRWAARIGGLAVCANQRRVSGCWRELSKLRCGPKCTGSFPNFSNLSS
jgi:hypothetical protein